MVKNKIKKRKVGRPKKRGPKKKRKYVSKKPKIDGRTLVSHRVYYNYKIITCHNMKKNGTVGKYKTIEEAYKALKELESANKDVVFRRLTTSQEKVKDSIDEYILLEENRNGDKKNYNVRNIYGKFVEVETNINDWIVIDKANRYVEETFSVFGYDNKSDRKTFTWIYENLIKNVNTTEYEFKRVLVYKNKLVVRNTDNSFEIVFCKNKRDAVRFYNLVSSKIKEEKVKSVYMYGSYDELGEKRKKLEKMLMDYTGYSKSRIQDSQNTSKARG